MDVPCPSRAQDAAKQEKPHWVYAICCLDSGGGLYIKFGRSSDVNKRVSELSTGCPLSPHSVYSARYESLAGAAEVEKNLHKMFEDERENGEWFLFRHSNEARVLQRAEELCKFVADPVKTIRLGTRGQHRRSQEAFCAASRRRQTALLKIMK